MNNDEYVRGFEAGEDYTLENIELYLPNFNNQKLWSLLSAVQVELEGRDDSIGELYDVTSSGDLHEEVLQTRNLNTYGSFD